MERDKFDDLLDSALASYCSAQPRPGLERRVVNNVLTARRPFRFPRWTFAIPVVASLVFLLIHRTQSPPRPTPPPVTAHNAVRHPETVRTTKAAAPRRHVRTRSAPKPTSFPTPSPLTAEERAVLQLVARAPEQVAGFAGELAATIQPIRIEPLTDLRGENEND